MARDYLLVDTDIHPALDPASIQRYLPEPWRTQYVSGSRGPGLPGYFNPHGVRRRDVTLDDGTSVDGDPHRLSELFLDKYGIDYAVINNAGLSVALHANPAYAAALCSAANDVVIHEWLPTDSRLRASILVSPQDPDLAVQEIRRHGEHPAVVQVLMPGSARIPYGQRLYHPIYAAAAEMGLPLSVHPGSEGAGVSAPPSTAGYPSTYFEWHTGLVTTYISQLISLVTEGVFVKFPTLKFVLIEGGVSWLPPILWRLDKNWKALRRETPWLDRLPSEIVSEHVLLTTQPIEEPERPEHLRAILEMFDAAHMLMFSSDFPHWDGDTPDFVGRHITPHLHPRVMGETAHELYRLGGKADD